MLQRFDTLPSDARLWVYASRKPISFDTADLLLGNIRSFIAGWTTHGHDVVADVKLVHNRFLLLGAHVPGASMSGCGIDDSTRQIEDIGTALGISWGNGLSVSYRDGEGDIHVVTRAEFSRLVASASVTANTPVFDLSVTGIADWKLGKFEQPASRTWYGQAFELDGS